MKCKQAEKLLGPYLDGELDVGTAREVGNHLGSCPRCSHSLDRMRSLLAALAALPRVAPTELETRRLLNRLRSETPSPAVPFRIPRITAPYRRLVTAGIAAIAVLALLAMGITWPLLRQREPSVTVQEVPQATETTSGDRLSGTEAGEGETAGPQVVTATASAIAVRPSLALSQKEYTGAELADFRNDLGSRLAFYSAYWYPIEAGAEGAFLPGLQKELVNDLALQASAAGLDAEELKRCIASALDREGAPLLPCYAELAKVNGTECWLISLSGPEDYLLFPDPQVPPSMHLAAMGGEESLKISEALIQDLADRLLPGVKLGPAYYGRGEEKSAEEIPAGAVESAAEEPATPESGAGRGKAEAVFQAFLEELAAGGTSLDVVTSLRRLNYEQLMLLVHGDWASLARQGVNLSDFLVPPKRLWAVERAGGAIIWEAP